MFGANHSKLKANLKLAIQRLKLIERKKTENNQKSTKEITDYLRINKIDRAKIKVEHIIREDFMVEGMEIVEMYCDLLLARFGLVESMKELDMGLYECVASILWSTPRIESECVELKIIANELQYKYGKEFAQMCRENRSNQVNPKLMQKMSEQAPGELLVEKYLVEIAKSHNVDYKPNSDLAIRDPDFFYNSSNNNGSNGGSSSKMPQQSPQIGFSQNLPSQPTPADKSQQEASIIFPDIPTGNDQKANFNLPDNSSDSFDDLAKRFENLKKK